MAPAARPRAASEFGGDLEALAIAQRECHTFAVYAFKMRRIGRICVQRMGIVAKVQLAGLDL